MKSVGMIFNCKMYLTYTTIRSDPTGRNEDPIKKDRKKAKQKLNNYMDRRYIGLGQRSKKLHSNEIAGSS